MDSVESIKYSSLKLGKAIATNINAGPTVQISSINVILKFPSILLYPPLFPSFGREHRENAERGERAKALDYIFLIYQLSHVVFEDSIKIQITIFSFSTGYPLLQPLIFTLK